MKTRTDNERLGDISYQLRRIANILEMAFGKDLTVDPEYFNQQMKKNHKLKD